MTTPPKIHKGLVGTYVDDSRISAITEETSSLTYRGYAVQDLCKDTSFEEVAFLLWNGELPTETELNDFQKEERSLRTLDEGTLKVLKEIRNDAHPMDVLRTAISFIGGQDPNWSDETPEGNMQKSMNLMAKIPTIIAANIRIKEGKEPIAPRDDLSVSENFFHMAFGKVPEPEIVKAFDVTMILYAEHSFNVSTFTARTITSSLSDMYSAVTGAVGSLKGRLHGGANEAVMHMIDEIQDPKKAQQWIDDAIDQKKVIMGFGHRVYKNGDSRVPTLKKYFNKVSQIKDAGDIKEISDILENTMLEKKNIRPNVDFPTGPLYHMMGLETDVFTPLFVMARITGWTAHIMEQMEDNKLIRPLCTYSGEKERAVPSIAKRSDKAKIAMTRNMMTKSCYKKNKP